MASTGDTNCCTAHSNKCADCGKYIDEDATWCMSCLEKSLNGYDSGSSDYSSESSSNSSDSSSHSSGSKSYYADDADTNSDGYLSGSEYEAQLDKLLSDLGY